MTLAMQMILEYKAVPDEVVWQRLRKSHPEIVPKASHFNIKRKTKSGAAFDYSHIRDHSLVWLDNAANDDVDAWCWCRPFCVDSAFRQAFVYDEDYKYWQNEKHLEVYEYECLSHTHLPKVKDKFGQIAIDISRNPGRRVIREGYVEFVSALMWLGSPFWKLSSAKRQKVLSQSWLKCKELPNDVLQVQAWDKPFTSAEGEQGEIQNRLRDLLFPQHVTLEKADEKKNSRQVMDLEAVIREAKKEVQKKGNKK